MKKVYQKKDMFSNVSSLRIDVAGKSKTIAFENKRRNGILTFETSDEEVQKGIEASNQYAAGKIVCVEGIVAPKAPVKTEEKYTGEGEKGHLQEYPEVTTFAQAKEYFGDQIDFYLDGGEITNTAPSNLYLWSKDGMKQLR